MSPFKLGCTILPIGSFLSLFKTFLGSERDENFSLKLADDSRLIPPSSKIREIKVNAKDIKSDRLTFIMSKLESFLDKNEI